MKRLTFLATALASLFLAASCQQDNLEPVAQDTAVKFQVEVPGGMNTKAIADASEINVVHYEIYKVEHADTDNADYTYSTGEALAKGHVEVSNKTADVTFDLLVDQKYVAIFWAQQTDDAATGANAYYVIDDLREISLKDAAKATGNAESRAAFFRTYMFSTETVQDHKVTLYRPFAQLNLGTTQESLEPEQTGEETDGGYSIVLDKSQVLVTGLATKFNTLAGIENLTVENNDDVHCGEAVLGSTTSYAFDFESADVPSKNSENEFLQVTDKNGVTTDYKYVAMNYFFATNNVTVEYNIVTDKGTVNNTVTNVPVGENFRTNIIGNLLTSKTDFEIVIDERFVDGVTGDLNPDKNLHMVFDEYQLQAALDAATDPGDYAFYIGGDIVGDVMITQREGVNIVIDGSKYPAEGGPKFDGTITINGNARSTGAETLTFKNLKFETKTAKTFIDAPTKIDNKYNYSHNVTVENCSFAAEAYNEEVVGIKLLTTYNAVIRNCSAKNIHSLAQFQSVDNATVIENVTVENCKNGISLGNMASATITGAKISAKGYGIRLDGEKSREVGVTITDSEISAYIPVNVRKMNNDDCKATVNLQGENTLAGATYEVAFCSNEYEEGVAPVSPKGTFTLDGAEKYDVYFGDSINTTSAFEAAINSNVDVIDVEAKIENVGIGFEVERDVVFNFNDEELNAGSTATSTWYALQIIGDYDVVINDANFTRAGVYAAEGADVLFNSGVINHKPERTSRYIFCAQSGSTITILDGTFNNDRQKNAYFWADNATIYVKGGTFGGVASNKKVVLSNGGKVIISGGTFNFDPTPYLAVGFSVEKVGSNWKVVAANNGDKLTIDGVEYTYADDATAFDAAIAESNAVALGEGTFTLPAISKDMTIKGSENTVITINKPNMSGSNLTLDGVTVKGSGYATGVQHVNTVTYKNATIVGEMCLYGEENTFEDCTFELNNQYIWVYGSKVAVFTGCTFNTNGKAILVYNEGAGATKVTVKGCTFNATAGAKAGAIANQNCAAIEIDNFQSSGVGVAHEVITSENTFANHFSGEWRIKNFVAGNAITVNGTAYEQIAVDGKLMTIDASKNVTVLQ